ncbi:flagellar basal body rod protein FlgC [Variovorax arabinosiphilus]|uniref:flagellar basal body rod protein FlgC n=1 Tax=Variovorax arabinosiphilus TaxID=3053498 RepID=UPI002577EBD5|nr:MULTISPECIES: flagellar basal body rod protein FlgC [unclassified Variovorax]MDM0122188.1 flagellar basal body rod protein FlgC [Variovorax sp. J2L1-78]MDM0131283.1 flagellar basal body rod protein FlgC [Variovorax sp. J2L1-63]MDM0234951.1 flagellar basal body rod protein FlgC [Variovorax sp. J2R1-6]
MDYSQSFAISAVGMGIERMRVEVAALNLANANTVQGTDAGSYQPLRVVAQAETFASMVGLGPDRSLPFAGAVPVASIVPMDVEPRRLYEPGHPLADARGFVSYPAVDPATEMVSLMSATRAYEANVAAMNTARTLALRALDIGGGNT